MSERAAAVNAWEALFRAQVSVLRALHDDFPTGEISLNEYDVLFNLSRQPGHQLRIRDINKHLLLSQPSVSRLVDRLAARALLRKQSDPSDARGTIVCLTEAGFALFRKVAVTHSASIVEQMKHLDADELAALSDLTNKLRHGVDG